MSTLAEQPLDSRRENAAAPELSSLRVLIVHGWLYTWAGAERDLEQVLELVPHADILAGIVTPRMREQHDIARRARETWVAALPGARRHHRWFLPLHSLAFSGFDTSEYDLVVSISHAFEKSVRARKRGARHVCYCLTPPRYLWDLNDSHVRLATTAQRIALGASRGILQAVDRRSARGVDRFVSQSRFVADRVRRAYGRESAVVYPPVAVKSHATALPRDDFLLTLGRLVPYKRVDVAIQAAERLGLRLVVAGDGPERRRLERLAGPRTEILGEVSEEQAADLLSRCAAFVFCAEEDFGIAPVEANAHGAPVVALGRGGVLETMVEGKTAVFYHDQSPEALGGAIERSLATSWSDVELRGNAARFAPERFRSAFRMELLRALEGVGS